MASELRDQLQTSLGANYTVGRELGGGGMSRVFLARDSTLDRDVVVKVLSAEHSSGVSTERFRREIQLIAKLQHPHVVPVLTAGDADGALYFVMPFRGGETLRARLARDGPLAVADVVRILREVLDALSFAHSHGVIHRDIKPDNILLEASHAVVADFGVAKALRESGDLTSVGIALGTPAYMAPEQASADPSADHRADLYAVGVVAYEMLTGAPPFSGPPQHVIRDHLTTKPTPLGQRRSDVPVPLAQLVMRALEKEPSDRPQSAMEMLTALDEVATPRTGVTPGALSAHTTRDGRRWWIAAAVVALAAGFGAWRWSRPPVIASAQSIAIAPFSVATNDSTLIRMGLGLVTTVSANLDGIGDIRVADPISVLSNARSKGSLLSAADAMAIARRVGARSVVHGSLVSTGAMVRADAVLYQVDGGVQLARVSVEALADSLAVMTDSLTLAILRAVWQKGNAPTSFASSINTRSQLALRAFLDGERLLARGHVAEAANLYRQATEADTSFWFAYYRYRFARSWMGLSADTGLTNRLRRHLGDLPPRERDILTTIDSALTVSQRVASYRRLSARYPDNALVWLLWGDLHLHYAMRAGYDVREAIEPLRQAARLMPSDVEVADHVVYACIGASDAACAASAYARLDSIVRADSAPSPLARVQQRTVLLALSPTPLRTADSLITVARRDSAFPFITFYVRMFVAPAAAERPELVAAWDRVDSATMAAGATSALLDGPSLRALKPAEFAMRGDWSRVDELPARTPVLTEGMIARTPLHTLRLRVMGELQGMVPASARTADRALAAIQIRAKPEVEEGAQTAPPDGFTVRAEARWIAGLNALLRGDSAAMRGVMNALSTDASPHARIALRSLRAIREGLAGTRAAAAESLLVLERQHGEEQPKVWGAFAADRLLAAQWLADVKRYAVADSLLEFTRGFIAGGEAEAAQTIFAPSQLLRSRIAEGLGRSEDAVKYARVFLATFDKAPPSQKPLIDEARARIARLGGVEAPRR